ncbi:MAG: hypothetical protein HOL06_00535 [Rhodospirillaceae bacterium]|nr:hypothetical protein [Rhodospirillaceae bacterium]
MSVYRRRRSTTDPFTDLLFNALLGFTFLFFITIMFMNPVTKTGKVDLKAEYIITLSWPDGNTDDIDIWVEGPEGNLLWFRDPEVGLLHLDRDDRGALKDTLTINGETIVNPLNQEIVTLRGLVPGEYVVNVHYYETKTKEPVKATVKVEKVNPILEVIYYGSVITEKVGEEKTAVRFTIAPDGSIRGINSLPKKLVKMN